jgi:glycosyltransferase involved in cell wall biosynthesis
VIFLRWAWRLRELGHDVTLVSDRFSLEPSELEGLRLFEIRELSALHRLRGVRRLLFGRAIARLAEELETDVIHGHYLLPYGFWAALGARATPLVISPWGTDVLIDGQVPGRDNVRARRAVTAADALIVNSRVNARAAIGLGASPHRIEQIVWYADLGRFSPQRRDPTFRTRLGWPDDALIMLSLRNFRPDTNVDVIVRAFRRVLDREPRARLVLAAKGGPLEREITELVTRLGLGPYTSFCTAGEAELPSLVASGDVLVAMTRSDSTPSSLLEAMASGLPAVCAQAASIDEWLAPGAGGEIVPQRDEAALADAVLGLFAAPERRHAYGERNRAVISERIPTSGPGLDLERLYRRLVSARAAPQLAQVGKRSATTHLLKA